MCIISERASIGLLSAPPIASTSEDSKPPGVTLADSITVDIGAIVEASHVGDGTHIEANAHVHAGAIIGKFCRIGPFCEVAAGEVLEDYTVLYGDGQRRIDKSETNEAKLRNTRKHVEVLRKLVASKPEKFM
jgi:dynactin-6